MHQIKSERPVAGVDMDTIVPRRNRRLPWLIALGAAVAVGLVAFWLMLPHGLRVPASTLRLARAEQGTFANNIALRAVAHALNSVILDAVDSGRVEEVNVKDGALVKAGQMLFRLSNPQRDLELLARESDQATQIANRANLEVSLESSIVGRQRRLLELRFNVEQAERQHARNLRLARQGFISQAGLEDSEENLALRRRLVAEEQVVDHEIDIKRKALRQMELSTERLASGLRLINASVDALAVRAPVAGRLTDFRMQVGESLKIGQNVGRIDDPAEFKLTAQVDEYYLSKLKTGQPGEIALEGVRYPVSVTRIYPQIRNGQFEIDIVFDRQRPAALNPGQSVDVQLRLGASAKALLLPNGTYINQSGSAGLFVVEGATAQRRTVRLGRRNAHQVEVLDGLKAGEQVIVSDYSGYGATQVLQIVD
jgi:HlyD family secretion protein